MNFTNGFGAGGFNPSGGPPKPNLSQPPNTRTPTRPELIRVPEHALERMQWARMHLDRAVQAAEMVGTRFERLEVILGPEIAAKALEEAASYLERAKREHEKAEQVVRETSGR